MHSHPVTLVHNERHAWPGRHGYVTLRETPPHWHSVMLAGSRHARDGSSPKGIHPSSRVREIPSRAESCSDTERWFPPTLAAGEAAIAIYTALKRATIKKGFEVSSKQAGRVQVNDVIDVYEQREDERGCLRVRCDAGWISTAARDGTPVSPWGARGARAARCGRLTKAGRVQ